MARKTDARDHNIYIDTSAFIAFLDKSDSYHVTVKRLFTSHSDLVTSALVIAEGHGWFLRSYDRQRATEFLAFVDALLPLRLQAFDHAELPKTRGMLARRSPWQTRRASSS